MGIETSYISLLCIVAEKFVTRYMGIETSMRFIQSLLNLFVTRYMGIETFKTTFFTFLVLNLLLAIWVLKPSCTKTLESSSF